MSGYNKEAYNTLRAFTSGNILTERTAILNRWTEYWSGLYNYELYLDTSLLQSNQTPTHGTESLVEEAVPSLNAGKSPRVDNILSELLKNGGEATTTVLTAICQKILETKERLKEWTQSLVIPLPKKGNLNQCQNFRTIILISHPTKIMLRVILNRLKAKAEELLAEEQAGLRSGRSTGERILNSRVLTEKHQ